MANEQTQELTRPRPLRLWPGVIIVAVQWTAWLGAPIVASEMAAAFIGLAGRVLGWLAVVVWWAFFSRAARSERWGAPVLMILGLFAASRLLHESIRTSSMGLMFIVYALPVLSLAFVAWALTSRRLSSGRRWATMAATIVLACGMWSVIRSDGITGDGAAQFNWRWAETAEERFVARTGHGPAASPSPPASPREPAPTPALGTAADWPGFRGPRRDGVVRGVRVETDWSLSPPVELWRRPVGPGASSFAVHGDRLYTQEQHGDDEVVTCYSATSGEPVWTHRDATRFWDPHTGAGPRATPTLSGGRVYTLGGTGILNALDARDGTVVWFRNVASDTGAKIPEFGFTGSPLVLDDMVIVFTDKLAAFDLATGEPGWSSPAGILSFSSPHLMTIDGVEQVLLLSGSGLTSVAPADGTLLWEHSWPGNSRIVQPAMTADGDLLLGAGALAGRGVQRIEVNDSPGGWTVEERWISRGLKPYFNDFVVHKGNAFGFDGSILVCIDLADGTRRWKGGRYGHGQLILLADQDVLLIVSEQGDLALVKAAPGGFTELGRFPAIEGRTWNHPALAGDLLLVRNSEEMVAFRLSLAGGSLPS